MTGWFGLDGQYLEQPAHTVVETDGVLDLCVLVVETAITGAQSLTLEAEFRLRAKYSFGNKEEDRDDRISV